MWNADWNMDIRSSERIFDAFPDGVAVVDRSWIIKSINPLCRKMLHVGEREIGQNLWCVLTLLKWSLVSKVGCTRAAMQSAKPCELEAYFAEPIGRTFHFVLRSSGDGLIIFVRDITDLMEIRAKTMQLQKNVAAIDLVSLLAHGTDG